MTEAPAQTGEREPHRTESSYVGQAILPGEDTAGLVGQGGFTDGLDPLPGVLHAAIARSPLPRVGITAFDAPAAATMPGVDAVIGPQEVGFRCMAALCTN